MERRKILIATKTYPSISMKYRETVCTAGVLLDDSERPVQWIRIYPVRFRLLEIDRRYQKWSIISAKIERNDKDYRTESYRIDDTSIELVRRIDNKDNWAKIKDFVLPLQFESIQNIKSEDKSLGIIKPQKIIKSYWEKDKREWKPKQQAILDQLDLFSPQEEIEKIPYKFGYEFIEKDGSKHRCSIIDWEIPQLYRNCRNSSKEVTWENKEREAISKVKQKLDFLLTRDLHFLVGNRKDKKEVFMIIGLFYPPVIQYYQLSLF